MAQLVIYVFTVNIGFNVTEELLKLASMLGTTTGKDVCGKFKDALKEYNLRFCKLIESQQIEAVQCHEEIMDFLVCFR